MRFLADLHLHSRFSRATSRELALPELHRWAQRKGITLLGTGDVTHPVWFRELEEQLVPAEDGLFRLRPDLASEVDASVPAACHGPVRFVLQGEISSIYKHEGAVRKVHSLVFCPSFSGARRFLERLEKRGNVSADGRPILGLSARDLLEVLLESCPGGRLVPAHVWTPWFSLLGSKSGYDSVDACFGDLSSEIFALETGLSSDPPMNRRVSALDRYTLVSNSDAHSARNLGREATEFDLDPSYENLFDALARRRNGLVGTLEFFPEHGKYYLDGHRKCGVRLLPDEARERGGRCPGCGRLVTAGVLHRVEELADRAQGEAPEGVAPCQHLIPLADVLAECLGVGAQSVTVRREAERMLEAIGPEIGVIRHAPLPEVERLCGSVVAEAIRRVREECLSIEGGYDGEFGTVSIFGSEDRGAARQGALS